MTFKIIPTHAQFFTVFFLHMFHKQTGTLNHVGILVMGNATSLVELKLVEVEVEVGVKVEENHQIQLHQMKFLQTQILILQKLKLISLMDHPQD